MAVKMIDVKMMETKPGRPGSEDSQNNGGKIMGMKVDRGAEKMDNKGASGSTISRNTGWAASS
jgi:hypothetical protein